LDTPLSAFYFLHSTLNMKKVLFPLFAFLLAACGNDGPAFTIKGEFEGLKESELLIYNIASGHETVDTVAVKDGEFTYRGNTDELTSYYLVFPNGMEQVIFVNGGDELAYSAKANDLRNYVVGGNEENEEVAAFHKEVNKLGASEARLKAAEYIKAKPQSAVALYIFDRYFVQDENVSEKELSEVLSVLEEHDAQNMSLLAVRGKLAHSGKGLVGSALPDMRIETKTGDSLDIAKLETAHTLILYWASWMQSPYDALDMMREIREEYSDSALGLISVSADTKKYRWQEYSRQDSVGIYNYCDQKAWDSPMLRELGVRRLPAYIIADSAHSIVARGYDLTGLKAELKKRVK